MSEDNVVSIDEAIEKKIKDEGLEAPRVRYEDIEAKVKALKFEFWIIPNTTTTVCAAIDADGFTLALEYSACVSPENFNKEIGREVAQNNAIAAARAELWKLEGYLLAKGGK